MAEKLLRITCFYCDERVLVDFYDMRKHETAHQALRRHDWILGLCREDGAVIFDALCPKCGRAVIQNMIDQGGGVVDPVAKKSLKELYPDLFEEDDDG